jgi:DnaK suppressor protein
MVRSLPVPAPGKPLTARRCDLLAARVPVLRAALMRQRDFRREQLAQLADEASGRTASPPAGRGAAGDTAPAVREVQALVEAGALRALDEIELALIRIRTGDYGRCRACGADIPLAVLEAIPQTTLCLFCHRLSDDADGRVRAAHTPTRAVSAR